MATVCLGDLDCGAPLLRDWLGGDWGLLFSHPLDFQDQGLEHDRWLDILRQEFRARGARPLCCRAAAGYSSTAPAAAAFHRSICWPRSRRCDARTPRVRRHDVSAST